MNLPPCFHFRFDRMGLEKGVDYARFVDIADHFRVWNPKYSTWMFFSLARLAFALLDRSIQGGAHSPVDDAQASMALFRVRPVSSCNI